ncbi:hypothetical protein GC163_10935 [bacterium]|nr:hypothetical protein [bacterium]
MANKQKKSRAELESELKVLRNANYYLAIASVINNLLRWGGLVAISYFIYCSVDALAGESTVADIGVKFNSKISISEVLAWIFGIGGVGYGWRQNDLRSVTIERLQGRIRELETGFDPQRTSSNLNERGQTNPKDSQ